MSAAAIAVFAAAFGIAVWRYEYALSRSDAALDASRDADPDPQRLVATFWHEREAMNEYLVTASPPLRQEVARAASDSSRPISVTLGSGSNTGRDATALAGHGGEQRVLRTVHAGSSSGGRRRRRDPGDLAAEQR